MRPLSDWSTSETIIHWVFTFLFMWVFGHFKLYEAVLLTVAAWLAIHFLA